MTRLSPTRPERWLACAAAAAAVMAWIAWSRAGLILSHYDAKAHLVVARRVFDNLTPGWQQIGAVWLPLPHLINLLPAQIDFLYRTGLFASAVSILCFATTAWAAARVVRISTGSITGMVTATLLLALNPNLLYLHSTPMTEPLLIAVTFVLVLWLYEWLAREPRVPIPFKLHAILFAAAWTRYEAWLVLAAAVTLTGIITWRRGHPLVTVVGNVVRLSAWPGLAVLLFLLNSKVTVGSWFVSNGFYVPDPTYEGFIEKSALAVWWGTHRMSGYAIEIFALITAARVLSRIDPLSVTVSLFATAALPFYAFAEGHPFRIRYMIPLVAACALFGGLGVGLLDARMARRRTVFRQTAWVVAVALLLATVIESPPWSGSRAPVIEEAEWDVPVSVERRAVTACLAPAYRGEKILASMGSLAHYMQELSAQGFAIADFINEGNGTIWNLALSKGPAPLAGWMLVEEQAEGGDVLAQRIRTDPAFLRRMVRVCDGGGVALYRRDDVASGASSDRSAELHRPPSASPH